MSKPKLDNLFQSILDDAEGLDKRSYLLGVTDGKIDGKIIGFREGIRYAREMIEAKKAVMSTTSHSFRECYGWEAALDELDIVLSEKEKE